MKRLLVLLLALAAAGCSRAGALDRIAGHEEQALARAAIADVAADRRQHLATLLPPALSAQLATALPQMQRALPHGRLRLIDAGVLSNLNTGERQTRMIWEASDGQHHALVTTTVDSGAAGRVLTTIYVQAIAGPADSLFPLDWRGKSVGHYLMILLILASTGICLAACVAAIRSPGLRRRWLWAVGSLFSLAQVSMRWDTGEIFLKLFSIQLLGGMVSKPGMIAPWFVGFGLPVFAIAFFVRKNSAAAEPSPRAPS